MLVLCAAGKVMKYFKLLGRAMAKALQDNRLLDIPLSYVFYRCPPPLPHFYSPAHPPPHTQIEIGGSWWSCRRCEFFSPGRGGNALKRTVLKPALSVQLPALSVQLPALRVQLPALSVQLPALRVQLPALSVQLPALSVQLPALRVQLRAHFEK